MPTCAAVALFHLYRKPTKGVRDTGIIFEAPRSGHHRLSSAARILVTRGLASPSSANSVSCRNATGNRRGTV